MTISKQLSQELNLRQESIDAALRLINENNTIPFIARYRKEETGNMSDEDLRALYDRYLALKSIQEKREEVVRKLQDLEVYTEDLGRAIEEATSLTEIEDIYRPYRPKRRTRATIAKEKGYGPVYEVLQKEGAKQEDLDQVLQDFEDPEEALQGGRDILAEAYSDQAKIRALVKKFLHLTGKIASQEGKKPNPTYEMYHDREEPIKSILNHRILALNRGEKEEALKIKLTFPKDLLEKQVAMTVLVENDLQDQQEMALIDGLDRLIYPSIEREIRNELTERAQKDAIDVFAKNLKPLLLMRPLKNNRILAMDPGYRTGCKIAVLDEYGKVLDHTVVYLTSSDQAKEAAKKKLLDLIEKYQLQVASIGNGTASRETEQFISDLIEENKLDMTYAITNEAGASIYSASKLGAQEFPDLDVTIRGAISIGRRLQDPLAELVKIEPKHIGVGQYQHDLPKQDLEGTLQGVVQDSVNRVGVDPNTASVPLLSYVAGIGPKLAQETVNYREAKGPFKSREELKEVKGMGPASFQQSAGFLRIVDAENILDQTAVHPESYALAQLLLDQKEEEAKEMAKEANMTYTLEDIKEELKAPGRDPRDQLDQVALRKGAMGLDDLELGMEFSGVIRNVVNFGVFVDIGIKEDGLVHKSKLKNRPTNRKEYAAFDPSKTYKVGMTLPVEVIDIDKERNRVGLKELSKDRNIKED